MTYKVECDFYPANKNDSTGGFGHSRVLGTTIYGQEVIDRAGVSPTVTSGGLVWTAEFRFADQQPAEQFAAFLNGVSYTSNYGDAAAVKE